MPPDRKPMQQALKAIVVPKLRTMGFTGSLPHFRRKRGAEHQLFMLMFDKYGGGFYIEVGRTPQEEFEEAREAWAKTGKAFAESKLKVADCAPQSRARPGGSRPGPNHWFFFSANDHDAVATRAAEVIERQLEVFFGSAGMGEDEASA